MRDGEEKVKEKNNDKQTNKQTNSIFFRLVAEAAAVAKNWKNISFG